MVQSLSAALSLLLSVTEQQHSGHLYSEESPSYFCVELSPLIKVETSSCVSAIFLPQDHVKIQMGGHRKVSRPTPCSKESHL